MTEQQITLQDLAPCTEAAAAAAASAEIRTLSHDEVLAVTGGPSIANDTEG